MATFTSIYTRKTTLWDIVVYKRCDSAIQHGSKRKSHKVVFTNVITGNPAVYFFKTEEKAINCCWNMKFTAFRVVCEYRGEKIDPAKFPELASRFNSRESFTNCNMVKFLLDEIERRPTEERQLAITKTVFEYIFTDKRGNRLLNNSNFSKTVCAKFFELVDQGYLTSSFPLYKSIWNYAVRNGSFAVLK